MNDRMLQIGGKKSVMTVYRIFFRSTESTYDALIPPLMLKALNVLDDNNTAYTVC